MAKEPQYGYPTPGVQNVTPNEVMKKAFFVTDKEWESIKDKGDFDYVVIGSSYCALGFIDKIARNNPNAKILVLERGQYFHPEHFQNLPPAYMFSLDSSAETFPWKITKDTHEGEYIKWLYGTNNFFGGRSIFWSAWCPEPNDDEMEEWPESVKKSVHNYFPEAAYLMGITPADTIFDKEHSTTQAIFGMLQLSLQALLTNTANNIESVTRVIPAPMAVRSKQHRYEHFVKNSVPGKMLELMVVKRYTEGAPLKICIECTVEKILHDNKRATALRTSKGDLALGNAKLILAMGTLPPTTLMLNSFPKDDFPQIANMGKRFTAHFISSIIARVPRKSFPNVSNFGDLEIAAIYVAGVDKTSGMQFHIQLSAVSSTMPTKSLSDTFHHLPDVLAAPSYEQLSESKDDIIFVCGCVGQLDHNNPRNWFQLLDDFDDITCNATLQVLANDTDNNLWDVMDSTTFKLLEEELIPHGDVLEYWHPEDDSGTWKESRPTNNSGMWKKSRPTSSMIRVPGLVHEASTMWIGDNVEAPVGLDYRPKGIENVYITGGSLWPTGGSWNPTATMVSLATHLADTLEPKSQ